MAEPHPAQWRNIVIFIAVVLVLGNLGGRAFSALDGLDGLLFILSPTLAALALRAFGGDGWADAGFGPGRRPWAYGIALVYLPLLFAAALVAGIGVGATTLAPGALARMPAMAAAAFGTFLLFALLEEIGWRGYLEPRLAALGLAPLRRHALVGLVWALWHIGYILSTPAYSPLPPALFWPLFATAILSMAVIHGWLRAYSGSVWPNVLLHAVGNAAAAPLIVPDLVQVSNHLVFDPRLEGLVVLAFAIATAAWLLRRGAG